MELTGETMARSIILLVSAAVWALGFAVPFMTRHPSPESSAALENQETISDIILSANKGVSKLFDGGDIPKILKRNARRCTKCKWDKVDGVVKVPYVLSSEFNTYYGRLITSALAEFSTVSCVQFVDRVSEANYINIENKEGCWSPLGRTLGAQTVSLQVPKCMAYGVIQHEVMHSLSFYHEHNRPDRDNYVDIMWQYISPQNQGDFQIQRGDTLNTTYNYNSIMHYSQSSFSNTSGMPSIIPKSDAPVILGQRYGLTGQDVVMINRYYNCNLCRTKILGASGSFSSTDASPSKADDNCLWLLHVPGYKVFLQFNSFITSSEDCGDKIIVYDGASKTSPVLVTTSLNEPPPVLISSGLFLLVEYITDTSSCSSFTASYKIVTSGTTYTKSKGSVVSPQYPSNYPDNVRETSVIIAPPGYQVYLKFTFFDIELSPLCVNDFLIIRDGGNMNSPIAGKYCGKLLNLRVGSSGRMVLLQFSSNILTNKPGYKADYTFVPSS